MERMKGGKAGGRKMEGWKGSKQTVIDIEKYRRGRDTERGEKERSEMG